MPTEDVLQSTIATLDRADRLRRLRRYALELGEGYLQSVFLDMFGDPATNPKRWDVDELGELIDGFQAGVNYPPVFEGEHASPWRVLKVSAVTWTDFNPDESKPINPTIRIDPSIVVQKGDLLISRANTTELVGAVCLVRQSPPHVVLPDKLWRICLKPDGQLAPEYLLHVLRQPALRAMIAVLATGSSGSMKNISMEKAAALPIVIAPKQLQVQFGGIVRKTEHLRAQQREALRQAEHLFDTLLHRAFQGAL